MISMSETTRWLMRMDQSTHPRMVHHPPLHFNSLPNICSYPLILLLYHYVQPVAAQFYVLAAESSKPDFTTPLALVSLIWMLVTIPIGILSVIQLYRHRHHYPIAGRGSNYLIIQGCFLTLGTFLMTLVQLMFPIGVPCGLQYLLVAITILPIGYCYMIRGWVLVFRLEIQNYLGDLHWRQEQQQQQMFRNLENKLERAHKMTVLPSPVTSSELPSPYVNSGEPTTAAFFSPQTPVEQLSYPIIPHPTIIVNDANDTVVPFNAPLSVAPTPIASAIPTNNSLPASIGQPIPIHPTQHFSSPAKAHHLLRQTSSLGPTNPDENGGDDDDDEEDTGPVLETLPGYWYIIHRRYTEPKLLLSWLAVWSLLIGAIMTIVGVLDPDVDLTNHYYHDHGAIPSDVSYSGSQLSPDQFFSAPPCLMYSAKLLIIRGIILILIVPPIIWSWWKIRENKLRTRERDRIMKEEREKWDKEDAAFLAADEAVENANNNETQVTIPVNAPIPTATTTTNNGGVMESPKHNPSRSRSPLPLSIRVDEYPQQAQRGISPSPTSPPPHQSQQQAPPSPQHHPIIIVNNNGVPINNNKRPLTATRNSIVSVRLRSMLKRRQSMRSENTKPGDIVVSSQSAPVRGQFTDSELVKRELLWVVIFAICGMSLYSILDHSANNYIEMTELFMFIPVWALSIAHPLWILRQTSARHRNFLLANRESVIAQQHPTRKKSIDPHAQSAANLNTLAVPFKLHHHLPFYQLTYILQNRFTFPIFLAFLQKEYSSENALFFKEVDQFNKRVKELEMKIPSWPKCVDDDDDDDDEPSPPQLVIRTPTQQRALKKSYPSQGGPAVQTPSILKKSTTLHRRAETAKVGSFIDQAGVSLVTPQFADPTSKISEGDATREMLIQAGLIAENDSTDFSPPQAPLYSGEDKSQQQLSIPVPAGVSRPRSHRPSRSRSKSTVPDGALSLDVRSRPRGSTIGGSGDADIPPPSPRSGPMPPPPQKIFSPVEMRALHEEAARMKFWCLQLWEMYIRKHSIYEVNIPDDLSAMIQTQIIQIEAYEPTPTDDAGEPIDALRDTTLPVPPPVPFSLIYKQTAITIFDLIQRDSFRRFVMTDDFQRILLRADDEELARAEQQSDLQKETQEVIEKAVATIHIIKTVRRTNTNVAQLVAAANAVAAASGVPGIPTTRPPTANNNNHLTNQETPTRSRTRGVMTPVSRQREPQLPASPVEPLILADADVVSKFELP